jgi:hypothetical protein
MAGPESNKSETGSDVASEIDEAKLEEKRLAKIEAYLFSSFSHFLIIIFLSFANTISKNCVVIKTQICRAVDASVSSERHRTDQVFYRPRSRANIGG